MFTCGFLIVNNCFTLRRRCILSDENWLLIKIWRVEKILVLVELNKSVVVETDCPAVLYPSLWVEVNMEIQQLLSLSFKGKSSTNFKS